MKTPRPRPMPEGVQSPRLIPKGKGKADLRSGSIEAMKEQALRRAAGDYTDMSYKYADSSGGGGGGGPFPGAGWEAVESNTEFFPR